MRASCGNAKQNAAQLRTFIMEKVTGIGGLFFRSSNPEALAEWYATHLGVSTVPKNYDEKPWMQQAVSS